MIKLGVVTSRDVLLLHVNFKVVFTGNDAYWCVWFLRPCPFGGGRGVNVDVELGFVHACTPPY